MQHTYEFEAPDGWENTDLLYDYGIFMMLLSNIRWIITGISIAVYDDKA